MNYNCEFPSEGWCKNNSEQSKKLGLFLSRRFVSDYLDPKEMGYAWNSKSYWPVETASGKTPWTLEQTFVYIKNGEENKFDDSFCGDKKQLPDKFLIGDTVMYTGNITHMLGKIGTITDKYSECKVIVRINNVNLKLNVNNLKHCEKLQNNLYLQTIL